MALRLLLACSSCVGFRYERIQAYVVLVDPSHFCCAQAHQAIATHYFSPTRLRLHSSINSNTELSKMVAAEDPLTPLQMAINGAKVR